MDNIQLHRMKSYKHEGYLAAFRHKLASGSYNIAFTIRIEIGFVCLAIVKDYSLFCNKFDRNVNIKSFIGNIEVYKGENIKHVNIHYINQLSGYNSFTGHGDNFSSVWSDDDGYVQCNINGPDLLTSYHIRQLIKSIPYETIPRKVCCFASIFLSM